MSDLAIRVEKLGKLYRIGQRNGYDTLRDTVARSLSAPFRWLGQIIDGGQTTEDGSLGLRSSVSGPRSSVPGHDSTIWALKDVSFEVKKGEVVGIIGRNGAGKSTLLKILSRITRPTEGEAEVLGRAGSLLEVGTGFHPELTGRENIYLNGAILGMRKTEIERKFDEIVSFAEVEKFVDTPLKHYSSGMHTRLAFAVAAHLEPEILLVDEVLAVGDAAFQRRCLGKMGDIAAEGRTVLFVSHNMLAVEHLCNRVIVFEAGKIRLDAVPQMAIAEYLATFSTPTDCDSLASAPRDPGLVAVIQKLEFRDRYGRAVTAVPTDAPLTVRIYYRHTEPIRDPYFGLVFETAMGVKVFWVQTRLQKGTLPDLPASGLIECHIPRVPLVPGLYFVQAGCGSGTRQLDLLPRASQLQIAETDVFGTGRAPHQVSGLVIVDAEWNIIPQSGGTDWANT